MQQASGAFRGWIHPDLDEILNQGEQRSAFLNLTQAISRRTDLTRETKATLELLQRLIQEELTTDASSPLDYMVGIEVSAD